MTKRDRKTGPEGMRLYYMLGAMLHFDQSVFTHMLGMGTTIAVPTPIFLIDHPEGKVLFETGVHRDVVTDPVGHWGEHVLHGNNYVRGRDWAPQLTADNLVENQLAALGIGTDDIRYVVQSVLIPDHAGGVRAFPKSTVIVQYRELQDAWNPPTFMPYHYDQNELSEIRDYNFRRLYDEDYDVFGDGSVEILVLARPQPGRAGIGRPPAEHGNGHHAGRRHPAEGQLGPRRHHGHALRRSRLVRSLHAPAHAHRRARGRDGDVPPRRRALERPYRMAPEYYD